MATRPVTGEPRSADADDARMDAERCTDSHLSSTHHYQLPGQDVPFAKRHCDELPSRNWTFVTTPATDPECRAQLDDFIETCFKLCCLQVSDVSHDRWRPTCLAKSVVTQMIAGEGSASLHVSPGSAAILIVP